MPDPVPAYEALHEQLCLAPEAGRNVASARIVLEIVRDRIGTPASVLDVGCATGDWLVAAGAVWPECARTGIDGAWARPRAPGARFVAHDLREPFEHRADLTLCIETAEHLADPAPLLDSLGNAGDVLLFSAAIPGQGGFGHVHERWQSWWIAALAQRGFECFDIFRRRLWQRDPVQLWLRQNLFAFVKAVPKWCNTSVLALVRDAAQQALPPDAVHPGCWANARGVLPP